MPKKQSAVKRTQVKDLPKKEQKLSTGDMKKVKGGEWIVLSIMAPKKPK